MTEHDLEELSGGHGSPAAEVVLRRCFRVPGDAWVHSLSCRRCGRFAVAVAVPAWGRDRPGDVAREDARASFLRAVPWDCDLAMVGDVMDE